MTATERDQWLARYEADLLDGRQRPLGEWIEAMLAGPRASRVDVPLLLATIKDRRRLGAYIVPASSHWADWRDNDAIRCHGVRVGGASVRHIAALMLVHVNDAEANGTAPAPTYTTLFHRYAQTGGE